MIHRVFSTLPSFKTLNLNPGLNILVSSKTEKSSDKQTRNRAGKSSLIELLHFALGANANAESLFKNEAISSEYFGMDFDLGAQRVEISRAGASSVRVSIKAGDTSAWAVQPKGQSPRGNTLSNTDWKTVIGAEWFGLNGLALEGDARFLPGMRSLFGYFVRRDGSNGFLDSNRQNEDQQAWDQQVAISYLLGLDWTIARQLEKVRC